MDKIVRFSIVKMSGVCLRIHPKTVSPIYLRCSSNESGDTDDKKKAQDKLASLLKGLKTSESVRKSPDREIKLAKPGFNKPISRSKDGKPKRGIDVSELDSDVVDATKDVANLAASQSKKRRTESDLLLKLKSVAKDANEAKKDNEVAGETAETPSMDSLFSNIKIEKSNPVKRQDDPVKDKLTNQSETLEKKNLTMEQLAFLQKRAKMRRAEQAKTMEQSSLDLFSGNPLGIFTGPVENSSDKDLVKTWRLSQERELRVLSTPSPRNALEEMILQTKQGKLWHFPVNNEQGLDYSSEPFYNHVFLEHHLEPWCPLGGPVRHFMEVVCLGLSKNPYVSSQKKLETILWFKEYFERPENNEILVHSGFWEDKTEITSKLS